MVSSWNVSRSLSKHAIADEVPLLACSWSSLGASVSLETGRLGGGYIIGIAVTRRTCEREAEKQPRRR
jgi:hypothetical protein